MMMMGEGVSVPPWSHHLPVSGGGGGGGGDDDAAAAESGDGLWREGFGLWSCLQEIRSSSSQYNQ